LLPGYQGLDAPDFSANLVRVLSARQEDKVVTESPAAGLTHQASRAVVVVFCVALVAAVDLRGPLVAQATTKVRAVAVELLGP